MYNAILYSLGENLGCFGASKKKKDGTSGGLAGNQKETASSSRSTSRNEPIKGMELLWQPEVSYHDVSLYSKQEIFFRCMRE